MSFFRLFVDSDVVISSLLSQSVAAYFLFNSKDLKFFISNISRKELEIVAKRFGIEEKLNALFKTRLKIIKLEETLTDINDAHIVAGAVMAKVKFLLSYNVKHFKAEKIKRDFDIIVTTPANFLQYLRSL